MRALAFIALFACGALLRAAGSDSAPGVIQRAALDATRAYFVPTHPRVTTTIRFPGPIGAPDGAVGVFAEDAGKAGTAEYLVTWQTDDAYLTLTPLRAPRLANLNIPYRGRTYVFYFYGVEDPLRAVASVVLDEAGDAPSALQNPQVAPPASAPRANAGDGMARSPSLPPVGVVPASAARLMGFLDRLKLLHATAGGASLAALSAAMHVETAASREDGGAGSQLGAPAPGGQAIGTISRGLNDAGLYQIVLLRAVRDPRLACVGFICLLRNTSRQALVFDLASFGARAGTEFLGQAIVDAPAELAPGAEVPAYFIVQTPPSTPLQADNDWRITVELVSPRLNPGAALARAFAGGGGRS